MREVLDPEGTAFWAPATLGWTTARNVEELANACSISTKFGGRGFGRRVAHRTVHAQLYTDFARELAGETWALSGLPGSPRPPPLYRSWDESGARMTP